MGDESDVLAANDAFYAAFASGDADAMDKVWAREAPVCCCHPGWEPLRGRGPVLASLRAIFAGGPPPLRCSDATAHLLGEFAYVVCTEHLPNGKLAATNLFLREEGRFKLLHHHAGPVAQQAQQQPKGTVLN